MVTDSTVNAASENSIGGSSPLPLAKSAKTMLSIKKLVLAHRYLYYVLARPILSDYEYDKLEVSLTEEEKREIGVGSSLKESYSQEIIDLAQSFL